MRTYRNGRAAAAVLKNPAARMTAAAKGEKACVSGGPYLRCRPWTQAEDRARPPHAPYLTVTCIRRHSSCPWPNVTVTFGRTGFSS